MFTAGLLTPRSTLYPSLGTDWVSGIRAFLQVQGDTESIRFLSDNIGFGTNEADIYSRAEKMILQDDVDIVVLFADERIAEMLSPLFTAANKLLLVVNFGAGFPDNWEGAPTTLTHSLNFCLHALLTGNLAAKGENKKAATAVSYYDAGYRQCYCLINSHQQHGGIPAFTHVTALHLADFTLDPLEKFLSENPDVRTLLSLFTGEQAEQFFARTGPMQEAFGLEIFASPMMLEESLRLPDGKSVATVTGFIPWHASLPGEANKMFQETIESRTGKKANYFSLLGWETGMLLHHILHHPDKNDPAKMIRSLAEITLASPRGTVLVDPHTHYSHGPSYLATRLPSGEIKVHAERGDSLADWQEFSASSMGQSNASGWRNTYLCI